MAVAANRVGLNNYTRETVSPHPILETELFTQSAKDEDIQEEMDLTRLYDEGKEYTYIMTLSGITNNHSVSVSPSFNNVISVEIVQARMPFTEYTMEPDRNTLIFKVGSDSEETFTFDSRDYTSNDIVEFFNARVGEQVTNEHNSKLRMGEEEGTGKFYFYTLRDVDTVTSYESSGSSDDPPGFEISLSSTAFYPLGLCESKQNNKVSSTANVKIRELSNGEIGDKTYGQLFKCPFRYDLLVSDIITVRCEELDSLLNRGHESESIMPLGEFFLASPGMNETTFQKTIPDRPIAPPIALNRLSLRFTRKNTGSNTNQEVDYNFRGVRWFVKVAIKTLEISSSSALKISESFKLGDREDYTQGFRKNVYQGKRVIQGPKNGVSNMTWTP